jgi:TolB-like protein/DNA-binding SARP family transcriptional activator/Tfp pilus assembly protein PilF
MKPLVRIRLRLLGRFALSLAGDQANSIRLSTRKAGALLAYLAMSPEQTASREELATLLWGGCFDQQARQSLRQALALLRKELGQPYFSTVNNEAVRLQAGLWSVDACEFEDLTQSSTTEDLERAGQLFGGEFLSGLNIEEEGFEEWVRGQRQRMQMAASRLCESYATRPELVANGQQAVAVTERLLTLDPLREDWQRWALTLYARYRGKTEALAQAEAFAGLLQRELGVGPEKETRALVERIRAGEIAPAATEPKPFKTDAVAPVGAHSIEPAVPNRVGEPTPGQHKAQAEEILPLSSPVLRPRSRARLGIISALALGCLTVAAGIFGLTYGRSVSVHAGDPTAQVPAEARASPADSWQSPTNGLQNAAIAARTNERLIPVVVLPFASVVEGASSNPSLADQITDDLINTLSRVYRLRVISRNTSQQYKGKPADAAVLGIELGVRYVLEGSARAHGGRLRVNAELIDTATRLAVWSDQIEYEQADLNAVTDEIVIRIGHALQVETQVIEVRRTGERPSAVYQLVDKGWVTMFAGPSSLDRLNEGKALFEQALRQDPNSLAAQTGLAAYHVEVVSELLVSDPAPHTEEAVKLLHAVIAGDPYAATAYYFLARAQRNANDFNAALRSFARAIELNPSYTSAHAEVGLTLMFLRRPADALAHILYAVRLSPKDQGLPYWLRFAAEAELSLGHDAQAVQYLERSLEMAPRQLRAWGALAAVQALSGNTAAARKAIAKVRDWGGGSSDGELLQRLGRLDRLGPNRLHEGLQMALALGGEIDPWQPPRPSGQPSENSPSKQPSGLTAILVLPFASVGEPNEQSTLSADLMTDDLTNALSRINGFRVISRLTAMSYRGQQVDPAAVGTELGVQYLLEGHVETQGSGLRTSVELIETKTRSRVWSARYDRDGPDRLMILDDVVKSLGRELQIKITSAEGALAAQDPDVHALIYKGFSAIADAGRAGQPALEQSEKYFTQALAREPDNPRALTGLGMYHVQMAVQLFAPDPAPHLAKAEAILQQVIERHPGVGLPYRLMGVLNIARGRAEIAAQWLQREIELNPSDAPSYAQLGRTMTMRGRAAEGIKYILYAMRLSPRDQAMAYWLSMAGQAELELGHDRKAIEYLDRALALKPGGPRALMVLAAAHALSGNPDAARSRLEQVRKALPHLSGNKLIERYFGESDGDRSLRLGEGLRLALAPAADPWASPRSAANTAAAETKPLIPILILPFTTSGETTDAVPLIADMMMDDLTNMLSRVASFRVISRQTALSYQGKPIDVAALGAELQVRYILEGNMHMHGGKLRVNVELIDPGTRLPVWTGRIERDGADRYGVQDEIVARLARELQFEILPIESARRSNDPDADAMVYQGWNALFDISQDGYRRAESYFRQALERDPQSLAAQIGLGAYHARIGALVLDTESGAHRAKALEILRAALQRDPQSSTAYFYIGLALNEHATLPQSIEATQRAIELNPSHPSAYAHLGHGLSRMGKPAEGLEYIRYAMRLSPRDPTMAVFLEMAGNAELELQHYDEAIESFRRATALKPGYPRPWAGLVAAHALAGRNEEARRYAEKLKAFAPNLTGDALIRQFGRHDKARVTEGLRLLLAPSDRSQSPQPLAGHAPG